LQPAVHAPVDLRERLAPTAQVGTALVASAIAGFAVVATGSWSLTLGGVGVAALVALGFLRPALFLMLFLLVRPLLDDLPQASLGLPPPLTVAGGIGVVLVAFTVVLMTTSPNVFRSPLVVAFGLVALLSAAGAYVAVLEVGPSVGLRGISETLRLAALCGVYLLAANVLSSPRRIRQLFVVVALSGVIPAAIGVNELLTGVEVDSKGLARISGPFVGPNPLGMYCALTALTLIALPRRWLPAWVRLAALAPILVALVATYSRVGWIVLLLGLLLLEWRRRRRYVLGGIALVAAVVVAFPSVQHRLFPTSEPGSDSPGTYQSYTGRIGIWRGLLDKFAERPLIGHGTETTIYVNPRRTTRKRLLKEGGFEAHNTVVRVLVEGGLVLLAAYVIFMLCVFRTVHRLARDRWDFQPLAKLVAVVWLVFTVVALGTDDPFQATAWMFALFAMTAAVEGARWRAGAPVAGGTRSNLVLAAHPNPPKEDSNG
jgi:O-antigen ligase